MFSLFDTINPNSLEVAYELDLCKYYIHTLCITSKVSFFSCWVGLLDPHSVCMGRAANTEFIETDWDISATLILAQFEVTPTG